MNLSALVGLAALYSVAGFVQGFTGFAYGLIMVPVLSLFYFEPSVAVGMTAMTAMFQVVLNYLLHRRLVEHRRIVRLALISILCIPIGALFLYSVDESIAMGVLGMSVIAITVLGNVISAGQRQALLRRPVAVTMTALSGLVAGAFSTPGPVIVGYLYASDDDRHRAKANAQFYYVLVTGVIIVAHVVGGGVSVYSAARALPFVPFVLVGTKAGARLSTRIPTRSFRLMTDLFLIAMGLFLVVNNLVL